MNPGLTIAAAGAISALGAIARGKWPSPKIFLGAAIAGGGLLLLAQSEPEAAQKLATVVLLTSILTSGYDVAHGLNKTLNPTVAAAEEKSTPT